jgi:molecular chaperone DnaJ
MGAKRDYYDVLGVGRNAGNGDLKAAYRKQALKFHPDRNPGDKSAEDKFKAAAEAYEVLRDPQKRQIYDQFGHEGLEGAGFSGFGGFDDIFSSFGSIFEDLFGFGGGRRGGQGRAQRGSDLRYDLSLSFMEAAFGKETELELDKAVVCPSCNGQRCAPGSQPEACGQCQGTGQVSRTQGFFTVRTTCPACRGSGQHIAEPCPECRGNGQILKKKKVTLKIPAGVDSGSRLRLSHEGEPGVYGGPPGDLYVYIRVEEHDFFQRRDSDVIASIPISFVQAALGDEIKVPTLDGDSTLKIPKGTQPGELFRLRGQGIPSLRRKGRGDIIFQVNVQTPTGINKKQESLLREFAKIEEKKFSKKLKNILKGDSARAFH